MNEKKAQFLQDVRTYANFGTHKESEPQEYYDFSMDPELAKLYQAECDAEDAVILYCRKKLKEAGLDK